MRIKGSWAIVWAAPVLAAATAASAQEVLHAPDAIRSCLCREQSVSALANDVLQQNKLYEEKRKALETLDNDVRSRRAQVNVANQGEVDAFRQLLERRDQASAEFAGPVTRNYSDTVARYNDAVAAFNNACAGKAYDPDVLAQVRSNLSCPKP